MHRSVRLHLIGIWRKLLALPKDPALLSPPLNPKLNQKGRSISRVQPELLDLGPDASLPSQPLITFVNHVHIRDMLQCRRTIPQWRRQTKAAVGI